MLVFDIETDGLYEETTKVHCLVIYNTRTDTVHVFDPRTRPIEDGIRMLQDAEIICGHNIISFDIPVIKKLYPWFDFKGEAVDTLVIKEARPYTRVMRSCMLMKSYKRRDIIWLF